MRHLIKSLGLATIFATILVPVTSQASAEPLLVELVINIPEPAEVTYDRAKRTAIRACAGLQTPWVGAWAAERDCRLDLLDQFVVQAGKSDLVQIHHERTGSLAEQQEATLVSKTQ